MKHLTSLRIDDTQLTEFDKVKKRQQKIADFREVTPHLFDTHGLPEIVGIKNCENWIGSVVLPVGVAGPLRFSYQSTPSEYYVPLATTEGALVASVNRGAKAISGSDKSDVVVKKMGMSRAPVFSCKSGAHAMELSAFIDAHSQKIAEIAQQTSGHISYMNHHSWVRGKNLYVRFNFDTDQAMGMNMVTIATQAIATWLEGAVDGIKLTALSSNVCTDKKDNYINSVLGRGYWAQAEVLLSEEVVSSVLKTTTDDLLQTHLDKNLIGSNLAGSLSQNAHVANVLSAFFLATGQDPAHVVEGSKAFLSLVKEDSGLYAAVTLPNINIGTVGGGTYLPAQKEARTIVAGKAIEAQELVAVTAMACLAGELSLLASLTQNSLAKAHQKLARS